MDAVRPWMRDRDIYIRSSIDAMLHRSMFTLRAPSPAPEVTLLPRCETRLWRSITKIRNHLRRNASRVVGPTGLPASINICTLLFSSWWQCPWLRRPCRGGAGPSESTPPPSFTARARRVICDHTPTAPHEPPTPACYSPDEFRDSDGTIRLELLPPHCDWLGLGGQHLTPANLVS